MATDGVASRCHQTACKTRHHRNAESITLIGLDFNPVTAMPRPRTSRPRLSILPIALALLAADAHAVDPEPRDADDEALHCIEVEVNGERIPDYDCFSQMLAGQHTTADGRPAAMTASERIARRPPAALGLADRAATSQRMGNTFGKSTTPQRPPPPAPRPVVPNR
ncbi:hypothetical protein [Xanthomonas sp. 1678]|uniref:hypothetical protein n=1 Tax=Xanthomonas sp. 1678 TaxID=3158788 RepID=UPI0028543C4D|nr:hypothetical protein [Xanthomonas translucens]